MNSHSVKNFAQTKIGIGIIIVCVCIIVWLISYWNLYGSDYENFMYGYWVADGSFCDQSEIDSMMMFIGSPSTGSIVTRPAHMIITDDIMNQKIEIKYKKINSGLSRKPGKFSIDCELEFEEECQIPNSVTMEFDVKKGSLKIYKDGNMYAKMHKDYEISDSFSN